MALPRSRKDALRTALVASMNEKSGSRDLHFQRATKTAQPVADAVPLDCFGSQWGQGRKSTEEHEPRLEC